MCGIVGLYLKNDKLSRSWGSLLSQMLVVLTDRGPDSTGFAIYGSGSSSRREGHDPRGGSQPADRRPSPPLRQSSVQFARSTDRTTRSSRSHRISISALQSFVAARSDAEIVGHGTRMEIYKEVGLPIKVSERFDLARMAGTHAIGHTRMATKSAVTTRGAHPFSTGPDQCLVHNGSLSNHNALRRELKRNGITFATDNDSEVAAGYLSWRMQEGATLEQALTRGLERPRRILHVRCRHRIRICRTARSHRVQAGGDGRNRRLRCLRIGISRARGVARHRSREGIRARTRQGLCLGTLRCRHTISRRRRYVNSMQNCMRCRPTPTRRTGPYANPGGKHALACGLDKPITVEIGGHVGYYCAGMNELATVIVNGNAGVGVAENMMSGHRSCQGRCEPGRRRHRSRRSSGDRRQCIGSLRHIHEGHRHRREGLDRSDERIHGAIRKSCRAWRRRGRARRFHLRSAAVRQGQCGEPRHRLRRKGRWGRTTGHSLPSVLTKADLAGVSIDDFKLYGSARRLYHFHVDNVDSY